MDRREHPQLRPRSGAVPQLPPRPRPVPPLPPRQAVSSPHEPDSTTNHGYRQFNAEHYTQTTVSDELQPDALEDVTAQLERLKPAPEIDANGTKSAAENHARGTKTDIETSHGTKHLSHLDNSPIPISELVSSRKYASRTFLRECPERDPINFPSLWYHPTHATKFTICSHCYMTFIHGVECVGSISFDSFMSNTGQTLFCMFGKPRARGLFNTGDFQTLKAFVASRPEVKTCHGVAGVDGEANMTWYRPTNRDIDGLVSCEGCYEDYISGTTFSACFEKSAPQPLDQIWSCDIAVPGISRSLEEFSNRNDWRAFVTAATYRLEVAPCSPYQERPIESTKWYRTEKSLNLPGFVVCEACYLDGIANTCMSAHFISVLERGIQDHHKNLTCTLGYLPMAINLQEAIFTGNIQLWYEAARIFMHENVCSSQAQQGKSHKLKNGNIDFNLCHSCYTCYIELFGFNEHFKEVDTPTGHEWTCDFYPTRHGFSKYTAALSEAIFVNKFSVLKDFIVRYQGVTEPCPRSNFTTGRRWYGNADFSACPDCFEEVIHGTELEPVIAVRNQFKQAENSCDIYSPRMRGMWREACEKNDYASFAELARHRAEVYWQTVPVMNRLLSQQRIRLLQQQTLNNSSLLYKRLDMTTSSYINYNGVAQPTVTYGAADVGYGFATSYGVEAARLGQQASNLAFSSGSEAGNVAYLETLWEAVE
ncbi:hypothetical protein IFR05_012332 [Cadophora sp. M221]|nr:hypothetical protein IFR05_012332 [Cadophora sp. M221]